MNFFKPMIGNFSQRLIVPKKLVDHFKEEFSMGVDLKGRTGRIWHVGLSKDEENHTIFEFGWSDFVKHHHIEENDLLVFRYDGNSCFNVSMFDETCCEKEPPGFSGNHDQRNQDRKVASVEILDSSSHHDIGEFSSSSSSNGLNSKFVGTSKSFESKIGAKHQFKQGSRKVQRQKLGISNMIHLTDEEKRKAMELARAVDRRNPFFVTVMRSSYINGNYFDLPRGARGFLPISSQTVILQAPGKKTKWPVSYYPKKAHLRFFKNWSGFVHDNDLKEGYICLFEVVKRGGNTTITVHISP